YGLMPIALLGESRLCRPADGRFDAHIALFFRFSVLGFPFRHARLSGGRDGTENVHAASWAVRRLRSLPQANGSKEK
ncbi:hypothetical protein, partial [Bifidobacterium pseudocatenulatum]|uniref:hypothetical protein n=1 Tax=Bifidobacterium pseudocatenulatum TaxID=28026 RepID=UPI0034A177F9